MGEAILGRSLAAKRWSILASDIKPDKRIRAKRKYGIKVTADNLEVADLADVIVLAVKPQELNCVLNEISPYVSKRKLIISIVAGVPTARIESQMRSEAPVVRVMPNMPALIGKGISAICKGRYAKSSHLNTTKAIFQTIGEVVEVEEVLLDAVTAVSGSGPAYLFYLVECMVDAALELGLSKEVAGRLVSQTVLGSSELLLRMKEGAAELRRRVTSKGGTTEAAFKVFESKGLKDIVKKALRAACSRSKELSSVR